MAMPEMYELQSIVLNTAASDFASVEANGKIYFSSSRNSERSTYGRTKEPYLDIYEVSLAEGDTLGNPTLLSGDVNTKYHEGTLAVTPDDQFMFFTRVDYFDGDYEKASDGESKLNIYRAVKAGGEWRDIKTTSLESEEYGVGHPSITADGTQIYFASEAPGGQGGTDIYKADLNDGVISNPVNLGNVVNTPGDDSFPYIAADGTLYFASNGHLGLGGLDIFKYENGKVTNVGMPLNSPLDDFAFSMNSETGEGYLSSNREGGAGSDDIYRVREIMDDTVELNITIIDDETGEVIPNAIVSVGVENGEEIPAQNSNTQGKTTFTVNDSQEVQVYSTIEGYESGEQSITLDNTRDSVDLTIRMRPEPVIVEDKIILNKIFFDLDKSNIRPDAALELDRLVDLMKKNPELEVLAETYADSRGSDSYNQVLTERRAQSIIDYVASQGIDKSRLQAAGRGESNPVYDCESMKCTEEQYQASRRSEFTVLKK
jgi:outer membrane protein OmpA-like peptidoglycan-associated protein